MLPLCIFPLCIYCVHLYDIVYSGRESNLQGRRLGGVQQSEWKPGTFQSYWRFQLQVQPKTKARGTDYHRYASLSLSLSLSLSAHSTIVPSHTLLLYSTLADPEIITSEIDAKDEFVVLACDGKCLTFVTHLLQQ